MCIFTATLETTDTDTYDIPISGVTSSSKILFSPANQDAAIDMQNCAGYIWSTPTTDSVNLSFANTTTSGGLWTIVCFND